MKIKDSETPGGWLAFELSVLKRLRFNSVVIPFAGKPDLGSYLKYWNVRVLSNDPLGSAYFENLARVGTNDVRLTENDIQTVLLDAYVPGYEFENPALRNWFSETDAWWFDNVRRNIDRLDSPVTRAQALTLGLLAGDYVFSFSDGTRELRRPLSVVYRRLWELSEEPVDNRLENECFNERPLDFVAGQSGELFFLRLPSPYSGGIREALGSLAWREEWVMRTPSFWEALDESLQGALGGPVQSKSQFIDLLDAILETANHIPKWAVEFSEDGFIETDDVVEAFGRSRRKVDTVFTKDFSELTGSKAVIVTA